MQFNIKGIHCDSCVKVIYMDLENLGIGTFELNKETGLLKVDDRYIDKKQEIIKSVKASGEYTITEII